MEVVLLSGHFELMLQCSNLLNEEWKRSTSARVQSLENSVSHLPDSLLLLEATENGKQVIGHSRLTKVLEDPFGCWIGSVVINKEKRKKGYGKYLMQKTEEYARALQYKTAYLNTRDQQGFYEHLGYTYCDPVSSVNSGLDGYISRNIVTNLKHHQNNNNCVKSQENQSTINDVSQNSDKNLVQSLPSPPPPPPPPPPANQNFRASNHLKSNLGQYWMKKQL